MKQRAPIPPLVEQNELINRLGGPTKVAAMLSSRTDEVVTQQTVSNWRRRGIPFRFRAPMTVEANARNIGVPPNFLGEQATPKPPPPNEAPFL